MKNIIKITKYTPLLFFIFLGSINLAFAGSASDSVTINVAARPAPTVTVTANPTSVGYTGSSTISWSSSNADSCSSPSGGGSGTTGSFSTGALTSNATYTVTCSGNGSASNSATVTVAPAPSGSLSASSCFIGAGSASCNSSVTWSTSNPITTSAVTRDGAGTVATGNSGSGVSLSIPYGGGVFRLYNNSSELATASPGASCTGGTAWNGSTCIAPPVVSTSASPSSIGYNSSSTISWSAPGATSCSYNSGGVAAPSGSFGTGNLTSTTAYTIYCNNAAGTTYDSVTVTVAGAPSGSISPSANSCAIGVGAGSCGIYVSWSTSNPIGTSAITTARQGQVATGNSTGANLSVPYSSDTFYLYNAGYLLDQKTLYSSCTSGTTWNGTVCVAPSGYLNADYTSCVIPAGGNACNINFQWDTYYPVGGSYVSRDGYGTVINANSGYTGFSVPYSGATFRLYNNGSQLAARSVSSGCVSGSSWNGSTCVTPTGSLTADVPSCVIPQNSGSCNINFSWSTNYPVGTSAVTRDGYGTLINANSGYTGFSVPYSSGVFRLYNNGSELANRTVTSGCVSGTTWNGSSCVAPTGSLTPDINSCSIAAGGNACNINFSWSTNYPIGTSAVTRDGYGTIVNANSGYTAFSVPYSSGVFRLYNNGSELANRTVTSGCVSGTTWTGSSCALPTGTLSVSPASCFVASGASTCNTTLTWSTTYPWNTSAITRTGGSTVTTGNSGTYVYGFPYGGTTLYLINNGNTLDTKSVTSSCVAGTTWVGTCEPPTGAINASPDSCAIAVRGSTCTVPVTWSTANPIGTSSITRTPSSGFTPPTPANSGSGVSLVVPYSGGSYTSYFSLINNGTTLGSKYVAANCTSGTAWNSTSGTCVPPPTVDINASPNPVVYNSTSLVSWTSTDAQSCTVSNGATGLSGSFTTPAMTFPRTYTITCTGWAGTATDTVIVNVIPTATFTVTPKLLISRKPARLAWTSTNTTSCTGTNFSTSGATSGTKIVTPISTTTYTLTCTGPGGTVVKVLKASITKVQFKER